jgi:hypothetical protein
MVETENPRHRTWYWSEVHWIKGRPQESNDVDWWKYSPGTLDEWTEIITCMNILAGDPTLENQTPKMRKRLEKVELIRRYHSSWAYHLTEKAKILYERAVSGDYPPMPT